MEEMLDSLFHRVQFASAMGDAIELSELRVELEVALRDVPPGDVAAIRARFQALLSEAPPETAASLYDQGKKCFAAQRSEDGMELWEQAAALAPDHFELRRRLCMAQRALARHDDADASLGRLLEIYGAADGPPLSDLKDMLVDRFHLGNHLVTVHRLLAAYGPNIDYVWVFVLVADRTRRLATVQVETSSYGRERGNPFILGMNTPAGHQALEHSWQTLPPYLELRTLASGFLARALPAESSR